LPLLLLLLFGSIALVQAIAPIATHFYVAWSVCLSSVTFPPGLNHSLTALYHNHVAGTLVGSNDTLC